MTDTDGLGAPDPARPDRRIIIPPADETFGDARFMDSAFLQMVMDDLVARTDRPLLSSLRDQSVAVLWKKTGGKTHGKSTLGKATKPSGLLAHFADLDFIIWIAADHVREYALNDLQLEALVYHELLHCDYDTETEEPTIAGHDAELFLSELDLYGGWMSDLLRVIQHAQQLPLALFDEEMQAAARVDRDTRYYGVRCARRGCDQGSDGKEAVMFDGRAYCTPAHVPAPDDPHDGATEGDTPTPISDAARRG